MTRLLARRGRERWSSVANGDAAAAVGWDVVGATADRRMGYDEINKTRDYAAPLATATGNGTGSGANKIAKFGASGNLAGSDPTAGAHFATKQWVEGLADTAATGNKLVQRNSSGQIAVANPTAGGHAATKSYVDGMVTDMTVNTLQVNGAAGVDGNFQASAAVDFPAVYGNALSGSWRNLYIRSTGELGWVSSSRTVKKNIKQWTPDRQAILAMELVQFQYKVAIDPDGALQHGLIAEQLHELGLEWLVDYGESGTPEGVRYDRISLALLSVVQDHEARLSRLEGNA